VTFGAHGWLESNHQGSAFVGRLLAVSIVLVLIS
jgi:hypothetical protein